MFFFSFSLIPLCIVIAIVVYAMNRNQSENKLNDAAPVQTLTVRIASKRGMIQGGNAAPFCFMTFEAPDGSLLELQVDEQSYNAFREGEIGDLVYQRKRFLGFNPQVLPYDAQYGQSCPPQQDIQNQTPLF